MPWLRRSPPPPTPLDPDPGAQDDWLLQPDDDAARKADPYAAGTADFDSTARNPDAWAHYDRQRGGAPRPVPPTAAKNGQNGPVARALNRALDDWWRSGALPPTSLLRDGLLALEAGYPLDDSQCTLLLRTALARRKGMVTALQYQDDPERSAVVLCDALLDPLAPLPTDVLRTLQTEDPHSEEWAPILLGMLREEAASADEPRRSQAGALLRVLGAAGAPQAFALAPVQPADVQTLTAETDRSPALWTAGVLLLLAAATVGTLLWARRQPDAGITIPAGAYLVADVSDPTGTQQVDLAAFVIDATEVTNADYRACVERGACTPPERSSSATQPNYWLDPAFSRHPVVNVGWEAANRYCAALGKRLPTAAEWEVAASYAPATRRRYLYPWGDRFQTQVANAAAAGIGDTQAVGTYHPAGSSPVGMMDAAGNVAEWTSTTVPQPGTGTVTSYVVKGGAYDDEAEQLTAHALRLLPAATVEPWLGFRCAKSQMPAP